MKFLIKNKGTLVAVLVFVLVMAAFNYFKADLIPVLAPQQNIGSDVVELFAVLENVNFTSDVFSSPLYRSLNDFSTALIPQPTGRSNPFNIIGRD